ncbi:hypothetical protein L1887_53534 [Cichorium endivia]|nr:hypothetical protein L1887_53534 [Cichorium endivia]
MSIDVVAIFGNQEAVAGQVPAGDEGVDELAKLALCLAAYSDVACVKQGTMAVTKLESLPRVVLKRIGNLGTQKREGLGGVVEDLAVVLVRISVMRIKVSLLRRWFRTDFRTDFRIYAPPKFDGDARRLALLASYSLHEAAVRRICSDAPYLAHGSFRQALPETKPSVLLNVVLRRRNVVLQPPKRPVDPASRAENGTTEAVETVSGHVRVQVSLSCQSSLKVELVRLAAAAAEGRPALLGAGMRLELAAAAVLCEVEWSSAVCKNDDRTRAAIGHDEASVEATGTEGCALKLQMSTKLRQMMDLMVSEALGREGLPTFLPAPDFT